MTKSETKNKQVHITLSDSAIEQLNQLKKELGVNTISEVIRSSISLSKFMASEKANGNEIIIRNKKEGTEKILATLK